MLNSKTSFQANARLTKHSGNKAKWELRCEDCQEPRSSIQCWRNVMLLKMLIKVTMIVMQQTGELVHLNLNPEMANS